MGPAATTTRAPVDVEVCSGGGGRVVALLVDPSLVDGIRAGLDRFESDLCVDGYTVVERVSDFAFPVEVRDYLAELYAETDWRLTGAILVGDVPHAYQFFTVTYANPEISPDSREAISFQYYADLDGLFEASPGYTSPGGHACSYDVHEGNVDWEIWIGVLPLYAPYGRADLSLTVEAINRYFAKNHAYRNGEYDLPRAYLEIYEHASAATEEEHAEIMEGLSAGEYAWTPFSNAPDARIYFDSVVAGTSLEEGYAALSEGVADFCVVSAHGTWRASGRIDVFWVEDNPVRTVFFVSGGCAVGDLDHVDNFAASVLYSPTSTVLVAEGTTSESGGMGTNENGFYGCNIATAMVEGKSFGQAMLEHVNVPLLSPWSGDRESHYAVQVILGDPTLTLDTEGVFGVPR
jgi:hypothetical protein